MKVNEMNYAQAREWILANYFDGDEDERAMTGGDEENVAMYWAVKALTKCMEDEEINENT